MPALTVRDLLEARFGTGLTGRFNEPGLEIQITRTQLLRSNPSRVAFLASNTGGVTVFIAPARVTAVGTGIRLEPNGGSAFLWWEEDGEIVAWEWDAIAIGDVSNVSTWEIEIDAGRVPARPSRPAVPGGAR